MIPRPDIAATEDRLKVLYKLLQTPMTFSQLTIATGIRRKYLRKDLMRLALRGCTLGIEKDTVWIK